MKNCYIVDTNLLTLLVVGTTSTQFIDKHKRTKTYTQADFQLLELILAPAEKLIVTPNVLSEASNLLRQFKEPGVSMLMAQLKKIIELNFEFYVPSLKATNRQEFLYLGLTDASLLEIKPMKSKLITDDFNLYNASLASGRPSINFSHERETWLQV